MVKSTLAPPVGRSPPRLTGLPRDRAALVDRQCRRGWAAAGARQTRSTQRTAATIDRRTGERTHRQ